MISSEDIRRLFTNDLGNGLRIRHRATNDGNWWYATFAPATGKFHGQGSVFKSLSGFAKEHHKFNAVRDTSEANGWRECEYEPNTGTDVFITTKNCRAGLRVE
jgi:hypothetical protein